MSAKRIKSILMLAVAVACLGTAVLILVQRLSSQTEGPNDYDQASHERRAYGSAVTQPRPPAAQPPAVEVSNEPQTLHEAIRDGRVDVAMRYFGELPSPDKGDAYKYTPLALAVYYGNQRLASSFVEAGASVNHRSAAGWTPLMHAAAHGDLAMVQWLLDQGADADLVNDADLRAEEIAKDRGHAEVTNVLEQASSPDGRALIDMACLLSTRPEEIQQFIENGADPNGVDQHGQTALYYMLTRRYRDHFRGEQYSLNFDEALQVQKFVEGVQVLIRAGADPNAIDKTGRPLLVAWLDDARGRTPPGVIRAMMAGGADPHLADSRGRTALSLLAEEGQATRDLYEPLLDVDR